MGHPKWKEQKRNREPRSRNTGLGGADNDWAHDETWRRQDDEDIAAVAAVLAPGSSGASPGGAPAAPNVPFDIGPDRRHKWSAYTVWIMRDHIKGDEDTPTNGGYRSGNASASSINDGYTKAISLKALLTPTARVSVIIEGGLWTEDVFLLADGIDIYGVGSTVIDGTWQIGPSVQSIVLQDLWMQCTAGNVPLQALPASEPIGTGTLSFDSTIELINVRITGAHQALIARRRLFAWGCVFRSQRPTSLFAAPEAAAVEVYVSPGDSRYSHFYFCRFFSNPSPTVYPSPIEFFPGYAIKASTKISGIGAPEGGYLPANGGLGHLIETNEYILKTTGLKLTGCTIYGSTLTEGWTVLHDRCSCYGGIILDTRAGGVYGVVRGWGFSDGLNRQPGYMIFDDCKVHSAAIAHFKEDPQQHGSAWRSGGTVIFRGPSQHLGFYDGAFASAAIAPDGCPAFFHQIESTSPSIAWRGAGVLGTDVGGHIGVTAALMADPFTFAP